jgi:hypothetical protein
MGRISAWALAVAFVTLAARCSLPRAGLGIDWRADVNPAAVCPGESVSVSWDVDSPEEACRTTCTREGCGEGCTRPAHLSIASNPPVMAPYDTFETAHALRVGPIVRDTVFTFEALYRGHVVDTRDRSVHVVLPEAVSTVRIPVEAACVGDHVVFSTVDLDWPSFRSMRVRVVRICNPSSPALQLQVQSSAGTQFFALYRGDCTPDFDELMGASVKSATITDLLSTRTVECTTRSVLPEARELDVVLACVPETDAGEPPGPAPTAAPAVSEEPTATAPSGEPRGRLSVNANCRFGPGTAYGSVDVFQAGDEVSILARSPKAPRWWWVSHAPSGTMCWLSDAVLETSGPVDGVSVRAAPPLPTATTEGETGCLYQGPNDPQPACYAPCPVPLEQTQGTCAP